MLDASGKPAHPLVWKDTVDVPLEQTVRFVVRFDDRPGTWMYHCHILDHADGGMMGVVELGVTPAANTTTGPTCPDVRVPEGRAGLILRRARAWDSSP